MFSLLASAALLMAASVDATIYLSAFGSDNNNGATPTTAVATLARAYSLAYAQASNNANIVMAPGVIALGTPSMLYGTVTLTGAGATGNAAIYKFDCATGDTLTMGATSLNIFGVSFDGCDKAITINRPSSGVFLGVTNVIFENTNTAIRVQDAVSVVNVTSSRFDGRAVVLSRTTSYTYSTALSFFNSLFNTTTSTNTVIDTNNDGGSYGVSGSLLIDNSLFVSAAPVVNVYVRDSFGSVAIAGTSFKGPFNANGCSVRLVNVKTQISDSVFDSHSGSPALCVQGGNAAIINSEFSNNQGNSTVTGVAMPGAGIYMSNSATVAISTSSFKSNKFDGDGAGIHCESSRLTVGSSVFKYNSANGAAACSSMGCTLVTYNNTQYRNTDRSAMFACNLQ
jgi:hypothetical protein